MKRTAVLGYAAIAATMTIATACDQNNPTSPLSESTPFRTGLTTVVGTAFTGPATPATGQVVVCKTSDSHDLYGVPSTATFTYDIAFDYAGATQSQDQIVHTVTLSPGQCATVFYRPTPSSATGGAEYQAAISISERTQSGYSVRSITINQTTPAASASSNSTAGTAEVVGNYYHGSVVNYTNQTSGLGTAGDPDPTPGSGCVRSQGYFKTHIETISTILGTPVNTTTTYLSGALLKIGGEPNLTATSIVSYLGRPTRGDARISLERQLIAAELNVLAGAAATSTILSEINEANTLLAASSLTSTQINRLHQIESDLDAYNNGTTGISGNGAHCD